MKKIMMYVVSLLIMFSCVVTLMKPVSAEAPKDNVKTNACGIPAYNTKYVKYDDQFTIQKQSYKQFSKSPFFDSSSTYYKMDNAKLPDKTYVIDAARCFMNIMNQHDENNLFNNFLIINLVNTSMNTYSSHFYVWGEAFRYPGYYDIDLYRSSIYNNKKEIYYTVFHELGHMIDAYYIDNKEMKQYMKLRGLGKGYFIVNDKIGVNRDQDVSELFADDVSHALVPASLWPKQLDNRGTLRTAKGIHQFRKFLFNAMKNN